MRDDDKKKADKLLENIKVGLIELDEMERNYVQAKERKVKEMNAFIAQLAVFADTQATRAYVVRELYWKESLPSTVLVEAFGLTLNRIRSIAGSLIYKFPCENGCGKEVQKEFTSKTQLEKYVPNSAICEACEKMIEAQKTEKRQQENAIYEAKIQKREKELSEMSWDEYTETNEWADIRANLLNWNSYDCEICNISGVRLNIFLHKDATQTRDRDNNIYYVLCDRCIPRCIDLIQEDKREVIQKEFLRQLMEEWQAGRPGYYRNFPY